MGSSWTPGKQGRIVLGTLLIISMTLLAGAWIAQAVFVVVQYRQMADGKDSRAAKLPL